MQDIHEEFLPLKDLTQYQSDQFESHCIQIWGQVIELKNYKCNRLFKEKEIYIHIIYIWDSVIGKHDVGKAISDSHLVLSL